MILRLELLNSHPLQIELITVSSKKISNIIKSQVGSIPETAEIMLLIKVTVLCSIYDGWRALEFVLSDSRSWRYSAFKYSKKHNVSYMPVKHYTFVTLVEEK